MQTALSDQAVDAPRVRTRASVGGGLGAALLASEKEHRRQIEPPFRKAVLEVSGIDVSAPPEPI